MTMYMSMLRSLRLCKCLRDLVSLRDSVSSKSPKTTEARTSLITELVPYRSALTLSAIVSSKPIDSPQYSSEEDGSYEEAAVETSDIEIEDEIESTRVSPAKKRKNMFQDTGAESRKKRLLCQRSTEKYRDLEEEMKCYIQSMFNSSFTALGLEVCEFIKDRFIKLEEKILSSQTQGELASRIIGPNIWLKNFVSLAQDYFAD
ncbi:hypothetical protein YC2023_082502 [Brassica napus]